MTATQQIINKHMLGATHKLINQEKCASGLIAGYRIQRSQIGWNRPNDAHRFLFSHPTHPGIYLIREAQSFVIETISVL